MRSFKTIALFFTITTLSLPVFAGTVKTLDADIVEQVPTTSGANPTFKMGSGFLRKNSTSGKLEFSHDGTIVKKIGSGSGGGAGAISIIENGGFEDGVTNGWEFSVGTVSEITAPNSLLDDKSALFDPSVLDDYLRTTFITVPKGLRGQACEARFLYTGADANIYASVETESGVVLGRYQRPESGSVVYGLSSHSSSGYESIFYKCPTEADVTALSTNGNIRLTIYQGTSTDAASMVVEDVHFGGLIGLVETTSPDLLVASFSSAGALLTENVDWIMGDASVSDTSLYSISLNPGFFANANPVCSVDVISTSSTTSDTAKFNGTPNTTTINVRTQQHNGSTYGKVAAPFLLKCSKSGSDAKQTVQVYKGIPKVAENVNTLVAGLGNDASVSGENVDWINGNCSWSSTGVFSCPLISGVISANNNLSCVGSSRSNNNSLVDITSVGTSAIGGRVLNNGTLISAAFTLNCTKTNSDFKLPTVQPIIIGQVTNSAAESALVNVRTEFCSISNTGSATLSNNLCNAWVSSVSRTVAGSVTVNFETGYFSDTPVCQATVSSNNLIAKHLNTTASSIVIQTFTPSPITLTDSGFTISCAGKR